MKKLLVAFICLGLVILYSQNAFCQAGLQQGEKIESYRANAGSGFDSGNKSSSALGQLEQISGQKISIPNTNSSNSSTTMSQASTPALDMNTFIQATVISGLIQGLFNSAFSDNSAAAADEQKRLDAQKAAALAAMQAAENKRIHDSIEDVRFHKMMESYKRLADSKSVGMKTLSDNKTSTKFKTLDDISYKTIPIMGSAPLSELDRFYKKHNIHYDPYAMNAISEDRIVYENIKAPDQDKNDEFLENMIDRVGSFEGGKIAAVTGSLMLNIKQQVFSYVGDASNAVIRGDISEMQDYANLEPRTLVKNAIIKTATDEVKSGITDYVTGIPSKLGINCMTNLYGEKGGDALENILDLSGKAQENWETFQAVKGVNN